ncbi:MAG: CheY-like chemotaxis protein [Mariniflexile sp.]|jgi:CheY-like chemotaxis protein
MKILLVEDDEYKIDLIVPFIKSKILDVDLTFAVSVKSAKKALDNDNEIHVVLLDMTLPTFDMTAGSSGGRPQGFGGLEVLRYMEMVEDSRPVIIVTQFQSFDTDEGTKDISYLNDLLEKEGFENFKGIVPFSSSTESWKDELIKLIKEL